MSQPPSQPAMTFGTSIKSIVTAARTRTFTQGANVARFLIFMTLVGAALTTAVQAHANTLFEGWYEVYQGTKKIGYMVERFEFTNNQFKSTKYLKTNADGNNVTESLKAFSGADLAPQKYAYTTKVGDTVKVIDATFKGDQLTLEIFDGKKKSKETKRIKKGTFLSEFLLYMILQQKSGLKVGNNFTYNAIAEEDGSAYTGSALVKNEEPVKGKKAYRILNDFKKQKFFSWISTKGEPLLVRSPELNIEVRIADSMAQATKDMVVKNQDLTLLFGNIPLVTKADESFSDGSKLKAGAKSKDGGETNDEGISDGINPSKLPKKKTPKTDSAPATEGQPPGASAPSSIGHSTGAQDQGVEIKGAHPKSSGGGETPTGSQNSPDPATPPSP